MTSSAVHRLPPGQHLPPGWPVLHYGPVPGFDPGTWDLRLTGATADGAERSFSWPEVSALPVSSVTADLHCVTRFSVLGRRWAGVSPRALLEQAPPADGVAHVMVWAEFGYSTNLRLDDLLHPSTLLATHHDGAPLTAERGAPLRLVVPHLYGWKGPKWVRGIEYLREHRRGFWEERGYHDRGDPWREQRYAHQDGDADPVRQVPRVRAPQPGPAPGL